MRYPSVLNLFRLNGELHRDPTDGPAEEYFDENGNIGYRIFSMNGKRHRPIADGPAFEYFDQSGISDTRDFYLDGKLISEADVADILCEKGRLLPDSISPQ